MSGVWEAIWEDEMNETKPEKAWNGASWANENGRHALSEETAETYERNLYAALEMASEKARLLRDVHRERQRQGRAARPAQQYERIHRDILKALDELRRRRGIEI